MNSLEQFFHILYHYDLAKKENRKKGRTTPIKSPKLTMSFDFPDVDPPISNAPHERLSDAEVVEGQTNIYKDNKDNDNGVRSRSRSRSSSPNGPHVSNDEVTTEDSSDDVVTSESDHSTSSQIPPARTCHHPKHRVYRKKGLTTSTFVKITKNLALIIGIDDESIICRGCMKASHRDSKYISNQNYIAPKKAKKEHILNNLKIEMVGFNQRGNRISRSFPYKRS